jgi:hypothetical protein
MDIVLRILLVFVPYLMLTVIPILALGHYGKVSGGYIVERHVKKFANGDRESHTRKFLSKRYRRWAIVTAIWVYGMTIPLIIFFFIL